MKDPKEYSFNTPLLYGKAYKIKHPYTKSNLLCIASIDNGWGHVSIILENRNPTWDEMAYVKKIFFEPEELCIQIHPRQSQYVNLHEYCLHIWNPPLEIATLLDVNK